MNYRFSGHETFPCRYTWLPKAVNLINSDSKALSNDEEAIVELGVGRNMVKAIRFWIQAMGVAESTQGNGYSVTDFGNLIFGIHGVDRFLEDRRTLWLLHWHLLSHVESPLFAWDFLFNKWNHPIISKNEVLQAFEREAIRLGRTLSKVTLEQHFNVFLHTYVPTRGVKGKVQEDNLDCPLVELELIEPIGQKQVAEGIELFENVYTFRRDSKPDITNNLLTYCLFDYWERTKSNELEMNFREVFTASNCIGQAFKLQEDDLRERLICINDETDTPFEYKESSLFQQVFLHNREKVNKIELLHKVFSNSKKPSHSNAYEFIKQPDLALAE